MESYEIVRLNKDEHVTEIRINGVDIFSFSLVGGNWEIDSVEHPPYETAAEIDELVVHLRKRKGD